MALEIKIPSPGESITEVELASWFVEDGALVTKNQEVGEIESEKATLPLIAEKAGQLKILVEAGETVNVGDIVASIDTSVEVPETEEQPAEQESIPETQNSPEKKASLERPTGSGGYSTNRKGRLRSCENNPCCQGDDGKGGHVGGGYHQWIEKDHSG